MKERGMPSQSSRYAGPGWSAASGWRVDRLVPPSRLFGANGLRGGPDGLLYVAQVVGSQVTAVDPDSGLVAPFSPMGDGIIGPDDLTFDDEGNLYCAEFTEGRVSMRTPDGRTQIIRDDLPGSNPISWHQGRLLSGECRPGGRIMEIDRAGGAPRLLLDDVPMPNAFDVGPDRKLYFPVMMPGEIWRIDLEGGSPEVVARGLAMPDSVKFDHDGMMVATQVMSGDVLRIDPTDGAKTVLARLRPGLDNCAFIGERLFVSHIDGSIHEIGVQGQVREVVPDGLNWPMGLACAADGALLVADGLFGHVWRSGAAPRQAGMQTDAGFPGFLRGVAAGGLGEWIVTTANGDVARWWPQEGRNAPIASGFDQLMGIVSVDGGHAVAEYGRGRVLLLTDGATETLAKGLDRPTGLAVDGDALIIAETGAGRVLRLSGGQYEVLLDGLGSPEGLACVDGRLFVLDVDRKALLSLPATGGPAQIIAKDLPVGAPPGVPLQYLNGYGLFSGPLLRFAGLAADAAGTIYVATDGEGAILAVRADPTGE